jgi:hypothetical protein
MSRTTSRNTPVLIQNGNHSFSLRSLGLYSCGSKRLSSQFTVVMTSSTTRLNTHGEAHALGDGALICRLVSRSCWLSLMLSRSPLMLLMSDRCLIASPSASRELCSGCPPASRRCPRFDRTEMLHPTVLPQW